MCELEALFTKSFSFLTLNVPDKLQLYGLHVYYVVHICDFGMLRVNIPPSFPIVLPFKAQIFTGTFPEPTHPVNVGLKLNQMFKKIRESAENVMNGFCLQEPHFSKKVRHMTIDSLSLRYVSVL